MKKIKSPWYGMVWIVIWTTALMWFLYSGMFNQTESMGLIAVWVVMVGITIFMIVRQFRATGGFKKPEKKSVKGILPSLNSACPCGSGKKYKRCCGASKVH